MRAVADLVSVLPLRGVSLVCSPLGRLACALPALALPLGVLNSPKLLNHCRWQQIADAGRTSSPQLRAEPLNPLWLVTLHDGSTGALYRGSRKKSEIVQSVEIV
jgi:hypothetical protein